MTLVVIVSDYSAFKARVRRIDESRQMSGSFLKLHVWYDPSTYYAWVPTAFVSKASIY